MELAGIDEETIADMVADRLAQKLFPPLKDFVIKEYRPDELLNAQEICDQTLHCSTKILNSFYLYQPGFPSMPKGSQRMYSRKAVEKWIAEHQNHS